MVLTMISFNPLLWWLLHLYAKFQLIPSSHVWQTFGLIYQLNQTEYTFTFNSQFCKVEKEVEKENTKEKTLKLWSPVFWKWLGKFLQNWYVGFLECYWYIQCRKKERSQKIGQMLSCFPFQKRISMKSCQIEGNCITWCSSD